MKKSTAKPAKTAAPAKKVPAKVVKKTASAPAKRTAAPKAKAPAAKVAATKAPVVKAPAVVTKQAPIEITALINVGFGNTLYVRGEGAGLSWDTGLPLDCIGDDQWSVSLPGNDKKVVYKLLINDLTWSAGADYVAEAGSRVTVEPSF